MIAGRAAVILAAALVIAVAAGLAVPAGAAPLPRTPVKFTTDWVWQGVYAPYVVADARGYFAEEGLAVEVDRGTGSADAAAKVAAGAYEFGVVDLAVLVEFNARNPGRELRAIGVIYNYSPLCIMTLRATGINSPRDLEGRKIGAPAGSAARQLFPAFARMTGIDKDRVEWVTVSGALREPLLVRREVDATAPFIDAMLTLKGLGISQENIVVFHYPRHGLDLYGLAIVARPQTLERRPAVARGVMRAVIRAWQHSLRNPDDMIDVLAQRDPLINRTLEKERFLLARDALILTPEVRGYGLGYASRERLYRHIQVVTETVGLPRRLGIDDVYSGRFLPPREERLLPR